MSRQPPITMVGVPGAACEGDGCLPGFGTEADASRSDSQLEVQESGNTADPRRGIIPA